jgi:P4 family phage/plasmid primase-like protien
MVETKDLEAHLPNVDLTKVTSDIPTTENLSHETIQARAQLLEAGKKAAEEEAKGPFKCMLHKHYPSYNDFRLLADDGETKLPFKPGAVAKWICENEEFKADLKTGILYFYDGDRWIANAEGYLEKIVSLILRDENKQSIYNNILHDLKALSYCNIEFSNKIACPNGLLNVETLELTPNTAEEMPLFSIPTEYVPDTPYPQWQEWLNQVMPDPQDQQTLQEWSGYLILPDYRYHKLLYNYGVGRNGKGTWERTMQAVIGKNNCSEVGLEELDGSHRFALFQLYGKLFNSCSEPVTNKTLQTSILKKATGQDLISAERKGSDKRIDFTNTAKITVSANKFPKVKDSSTAFSERRLFLTWSSQYLEGTNQIQWIERNWTQGEHDERKGILCWMLAGLRRLLIQGHFTTSKSQHETEIAFQRASDSVTAFLNEMAIYSKTFATKRSEALEAYQNYCDFYGIEAENDKVFTQRLEDNARISKGKIKGDRAWRGVSFKMINEEGTDGTQGTLLGVFSPAETLEESSRKVGEVYTRVLSDPSVPPQTTIAKATPEIKQAVETLKDFADQVSMEQKSKPDTSSPNGEQVTRVCGDCGRFHLASCGFVGGNFETLAADWWAAELRCWIPRQPELQSKGENDC